MKSPINHHKSIPLQPLRQEGRVILQGQDLAELQRGREGFCSGTPGNSMVKPQT